MTNKSTEEVFDGLRKHPDFVNDPDLRLDDFEFIVERHSHRSDHAFGWQIEKGKVIGNLVGKPPQMG